jgi:iron-sulfur cluster repair protein YtfE (RIC family)
MTQTTAPTLTDVHDMVVVHRAFRREFGLLPRLVRGVAAGDTRRAVVLAAHARMCLTALHHHHSGEDDLLWPKLLERAVPDTALVKRMEAQHERVHHALEALGPALERWETEARPAVSEEVAGDVEALCEALFEHLAEEERSILPIAARHVTQAEWDELGERGIAEMKKSEVPILFGMILEEATPQEAAEMLAKLPRPVRLIARFVFLPRYRRYVSRIRDGR